MTGRILRSMNKHEAKKERLLELGLEVMQIRGYNGTSVKDIVDAAAVPKGSFYTYFDSKEVFAIEAIERVASQNFQQAETVLRDRARNPLDRLDVFFNSQADTACVSEFRIGCFMGNMCQEMADSSELIRQTVKQTLGNITDLIAQVLTEASQQGDISVDQDCPATANFLFNSWQGALLRMKAEKSREPLDAFLSLLPKVLAV